jgi:hypothetical protein
MIIIGWAVLALKWGENKDQSKTSLWEGFFIGYTLINTFTLSLPAIPIIPDIIKEESQGIVIAITLAIIDIAAIAVKPLYVYNEKTNTSLDNNLTMWIFCGMNAVLALICVPNIKNVIGSKEHMIRSVTSQHSSSKCKVIKIAVR